MLRRIMDLNHRYNRRNVELVADSRGVNMLDAAGPVSDDGVSYPVDVLVMATGYVCVRVCVRMCSLLCVKCTDKKSKLHLFVVLS